MDRRDDEYHPPLLPPGIHEMSEAAFFNLATAGLAEASVRRPMLVSELRLLLGRLRKLGVRGHIVVGGSLMTRKPNPTDTDIIVILPPGAVSAMPDAAFAELTELANDRVGTRRRYECDIYLIGANSATAIGKLQRQISRHPDDDNQKGLAKFWIEP